MTHLGSWVTKTEMPERIQEIYPTAWDGKIIVAGGLHDIDGGFIDTDKSFVMDPATGVWSTATPLPAARHHPQLAAIGDTIFAVGGFSIESQDRQWVMEDDCWCRTRSGGWVEMPVLPKHQAKGILMSHKGHLHFFGGRSLKGTTNGQYTDHMDVADHYVFLPGTSRWETLRPTPTARNSTAAVQANGKFYNFGGRNMETGNSVTLEVYTVSEDRWDTLAPMPLGQAGNAAGLIDGKIVTFGGEFDESTPNGVFNQVWVYDIASDRWEVGPTMNVPRHGLGGVTIDNTIYAFGGAKHWGAAETTSVVETLTLL